MKLGKIRKTLGVTAAVVVAISVLACGGGADGGDPKTDGGSPAGPAQAAADKPKPATAAIGSGSYKYETGLQVAIISAKKTGLSAAQAGAEAGDTGVMLLIRLTNGTGEQFDASLVEVSLKSGPDQVEEQRVFDTSATIGFSGPIAAGAPATAKYLFGVPPKDLGQLTATVTPGLAYNAVIFTGKAA